MEKIHLAIVVCILTILPSFGRHRSTAPSSLRCDLLLSPKEQLRAGTMLPKVWYPTNDYRPDAVVVQSRRPAFSWCCEAGFIQSAYRILVASSSSLLKRNQADIWDSGRIASSLSSGIQYAGPELQPGKLYLWKVQLWDAEGHTTDFSAEAAFYTGKQLEEHVTARYPLVQEVQNYQHFHQLSSQRQVYDFGRDAFCSYLDLNVKSVDVDSLVIHLGEALAADGGVERRPKGSVRYQRYVLPLAKGNNRFHLDIKHEGGAIKMPDYIGQVAPFRYVELEGKLRRPLRQRDCSRHVVTYPYNDRASSFRCSDSILNKVWDLCKYSVKATTFMGQFIDGDRERLPYEGDNYIGQLTSYAVDAEYALPRYSCEYTIYHPTWPTEWILFNVPTLWNDYLYTGDLRSISYYYEDLKAKALMDFETEAHLISVGRSHHQKIMDKIHFKGEIRDIIDWPTRDNYQDGRYKAVLNAYYYLNLYLLGKMAHELGKESDALRFEEKAEAVKAAFYPAFWDGQYHRYHDSDTSYHASLHANMFPLAMGLVRSEDVPSVMDYIRSRGVACTVFGVQFLLEAIYRAGEGDYGLSLLNSTAPTSWYNMMREGSTISMEAWGQSFKPNQDWNHIWGAAAGNVIVRNLLGVQPTAPGFSRVEIRPQLGTLSFAEAKIPTIKGPCFVRYEQSSNRFLATIDIPGNTTTDIILPAKKELTTIKVNGQDVKADVQTDGYHLAPIQGGGHFEIELGR